MNEPRVPAEIRIQESEEAVGTAQELAPKDRARFRLAQYVLLALFMTLLIAYAGVLWGPEDRKLDAQGFFSFVQTLVPPLITLVLGFYFNSQGENT